MKNYTNYVNDHSGSMSSLRYAAMADFNTSIEVVKEAASREQLDTVVSVISFGQADRYRTPAQRNGLHHQVLREITVSNPHVLTKKTTWPTPGGTPLYDAIGDMIDLMLSMPDIDREEVSVLTVITTDGQEMHSQKYDPLSLGAKIKEVTATGRWTFVVRAPTSMGQHDRQNLLGMGIPADNIQTWDTTAAGMAASTVATTRAMNTFYAQRKAGAKNSSSFYTDASKVDITALEDISKKVSLYVVPSQDNGVEIRPFILRHRMEYLKGSAFYQLTKTESKVSHTKQILVRDRASGKIFHGPQARQMIGLPNDRNARLHPGDHKNFDLFIQSESVNRKLVGGTGVVYWKEIGVEFTEADLAYLQPKQPAAAPVPTVVQLPAVPVSNAPTKSPIPVTPMYEFFETREDARRVCASYGVPQSAIERRKGAPKGRGWAVPNKLLKKAA